MLCKFLATRQNGGLLHLLIVKQGVKVVKRLAQTFNIRLGLLHSKLHLPDLFLVLCKLRVPASIFPLLTLPFCRLLSLLPFKLPALPLLLSSDLRVYLVLPRPLLRQTPC